MRLHRLVLSNYRGITHREIDFPDRGVVVVCGPNEVGKTSMIEALDLLLESKDRSTKKEVKQVKPTHADVGSEVQAEISTGPYRFVYRKRFHKKHETELTVLVPRRQQFTGDEAHEKVRAMLAETVDTELWRAQRVLQAGSTVAVDLSGCDALSRALDVTAGDTTATLSGVEPLLFDRIDAEYGRYFTPTGRPTGEWAAAITRCGAAEHELVRCQAAVAEIDERVRRHAELTDVLAGLAASRAPVAARATTAEQAATALAELTDQLNTATLAAAAARATAAASAAADAERLRLRADVDGRTAAAVQLQAALAAAVDGEAKVRAASEAAAGAARQADADSGAAQARLDRARAVVAALAAREEAGRLAGRVSRIETAQRELADLTGRLSGISLTEQVMDDIQQAVKAVEQCDAQLALTATTVEFIASADLELTVDGAPVRLAAGERWAPPASAPSTVELPGLLAVRIDPGVTASESRSNREAAQRILNEALDRGGASGEAQAREVDQFRRELVTRHDQLTATLAGLLADDDVDTLRRRLAELRAADDGTAAGDDPDAADTELTAADAALAQARAAAEAHRAAAAQAAAELTEKATQTTVLRDRLATAERELTATRERLIALRREAADDQVADQAAADAEARREADAVVAALAERHAAADPDAVEAELASARSAAAEHQRAHLDADRALQDITVELAVMGDEGRYGSLDVARTEGEHAAAEHARVSGRARAARLLRSVMSRHRDDTRQRYVDPFRAEIERLGATVFGPTFEVEVDSDLRIASRTLNGCTVPYESLSGGAKEQLGILARLATATLVAKEDSVPVVIDDALGFTDPQRLAAMGAVFDTVGDHGQVIVLTCTPTRYLGVEDAHVIELTA